MTNPRFKQRIQRRARRGVTSLEAALSLGVFFVIAIVAYIIAQAACGGFYDIISVWIGSPYI